MFQAYIDEILLMVGIAFLLTIIDTILFMLKIEKDRKDQFMRWFNILGISIILMIVFRELYKFLNEIKHFLYKL